jgi:putative DNA primase/helicase
MGEVTPFAPIGAGSAPRQAARAWAPIVPVPTGAPTRPVRHPKFGAPTASWTYRSAEGAVLGYVMRFNVSTEDHPTAKEFRPLIFARHPNGTLTEWRWQSFSEPRPLYNLDKITARPSAAILVCEGEKSADAAEKLAPGYVVTTSPGGSKSAAKADWRPVQGRRIIVWPDADAAGLAYADDVARAAAAAGALEVLIVQPPANCAVGYDAADALEDGFDEQQAARLLAAAKPANASVRADAGHESFGRRRRTPQREVLIGLADGCELWHDALLEPYVTYPVASHREHARLRSTEFRSWLSNRFFEETGGTIAGQALEDGLRILEAKAGKGMEYRPWVRVAEHRDRLYYDLCDDAWRAVECTGTGGWSIVDHVPVRSKGMRRQVEPEAGGMIEELRRFLNVNEADHKLVVGWLVAALRERGPFPILLAHGEHGSGKSVFCRLLRSLVDPNAAPIRAIPKDDHNLILTATNSWILAFDNLSGVPAWLADGLCRIASGDGFAVRELYANREETIFVAQRPIMANGIPQLAERSDLGDRALVVRLQTIPASDRLPERELEARWDQARPRILGALFDAICGALGNLERTRLAEYPRMADFLEFITAATPSLGWDDGDFLAAYRDNQRDVMANAFEADSVAVAIRDFIRSVQAGGWEGTAQQLLIELATGEAVRKAKSWPQSASAMGNRIDRAAPLLRSQGLIVERRRTSSGRLIVIVPQEHGDSSRSSLSHPR